MAIPLFGQGTQDQRYQQWLQTPAGQAFTAGQQKGSGISSPYQFGQSMRDTMGYTFDPLVQLFKGGANLASGAIEGTAEFGAGLAGFDLPVAPPTPVVPPANAIPNPLAGDSQSAAMDAAGMMADQRGAGTLAEAQAAAAAADNDLAEEGNWFDALNSKVDLMAMGAAMLANSGSGMGTAANIGRGLQAGIASRAGADKVAKDRQMAEALLLIRQQEALANMGKARQAQLGSRASNFNANKDMLASIFKTQGIDEGAEDAATFIIQQMPFDISNVDPKALNALGQIIADEGTGWGLGSDEIKMKKLPEIIAAWEKSLQSLQQTGK